MPADNPASWFLLMCVGLYFIGKFFVNVINESCRLKAERERACQEFFIENNLDKRNIASYNRYINTKGNPPNENYDARYRNYK